MGGLINEEPEVPEFGGRDNKLPNLRLFLKDVACQTWFLSCRLVELRIRDRAQRARIHSYARRLHNHSSLFLSVEKSITYTTQVRKQRMSFDFPDVKPLNSDQVSFGFFYYFLNLGRFNSIFHAVLFHNEDPSRSKSAMPCEPTPNTTPANMEEFYMPAKILEPLSDIGHVVFEQNLWQMETVIWRSLLHLMDGLEWPRAVELDLRSQLCLKLGKPSYISYELRRLGWAQRSLDHFSTLRENWDFAEAWIGTPLEVEEAKFKLRLIRFPNGKNNRNPVDDIYCAIPNFESFRLLKHPFYYHFKIGYALFEFVFDSPVDGGTWGPSSALRISDRITATKSTSQVTFEDPESESTAGTLLLDAGCLVKCENGRLKKKRALLFEHRLMLLRTSSTRHEVVYDVPREDFILVMHRKRDKGPGSVMVFWDAEPDGPHEVVGVELCFDSFYEHRLWAGFLALTVEPKLRDVVDREDQVSSPLPQSP